MSKKSVIRSVSRRLGYDVVRFQNAFAEQQAHLLREGSIDLVVDVGANEGQYAQRLRALGYAGRIISLEPGRVAYEHLSRATRKDTQWSALRVAAGAQDGTAQLHISRNSVSSSLRDMAAPHVEAAPHSQFVTNESVPMARLDDLVLEGARVWVKLDVQGTEDDVLRGAEEVLQRTRFIQLEMSLTSLYVEQPLYREMLDLLHSAGFELIAIEPGVQNPHTRRLLQFDGIFSRRVGC